MKILEGVINIMSDEKTKIVLWIVFFSMLLLLLSILELKKYRIEKSETNSKIESATESLLRFLNVSTEVDDRYIYLLRVIKFSAIVLIIYMYSNFLPYHSPSPLNIRLYRLYNFFSDLLDIFPMYARIYILKLYFTKEAIEFLLNTILWQHINFTLKARNKCTR